MNAWKLPISLIFLTGCGAARAPMEVAMAPISQVAAGPVALQENHFARDRMGQLTEERLREILAAPTFLEERARLGVVPVATGYEVDDGVPLAAVPRVLSDKLEDTGLFEITSEVTTDWPADGSISGLRELAARYRAEYLLLYRHRFVDEWYVNGWAWTWPTVIGVLAAPAHTLDSAGVLEATLFDVKSGTLLFTSFERVQATSSFNVWHQDVKQRRVEEGLLAEAQERLAKHVASNIHRLAAARPGAGLPVAVVR